MSASSKGKRTKKRRSASGGGKKYLYSLLLAAAATAVIYIALWINPSLGEYFGLDTGNNESINISAETKGRAVFRFIDVGQGDSALISTPDGCNILIDAGPNSSEDKLVAYLRNAGVDDIDFAVMTHPHEDHIGGADGVLRAFEVKQLLMPAVVTSSATYTKLLNAAEERNTEIVFSAVGDVYSFGMLKMTVLAPYEADDGDLNNCSIVLKAEYGNTAFMFTGDAEKAVEGEIIAQFGDILKCDVLKVGHHGSSTSTSDEFLSAVSPKLAVISCGDGNDYGHPHTETLEKLTKAGIGVLRTDKDGTIIITSDGNTVSRYEAAA